MSTKDKTLSDTPSEPVYGKGGECGKEFRSLASLTRHYSVAKNHESGEVGVKQVSS